VDHDFRDALQGMTLQFGVLILYQGHGEFLGTQALGNGASVRIVTAKLANVVTGNRLTCEMLPCVVYVVQ
jgi:hypothetical protein